MAARDPGPWVASALAAGRKGGGPVVAFRTADRRWWLWLPCRCCGGAEVPLVRAGARDMAVNAHDVAADPQGSRRPCPTCETRRRRERLDVGPRTVWYDTELLEWVLRLGTPDGVGMILPLGIEGFDVPLAEVYRAAGDIAYSGDAFDASRHESRRDSWGDERP
jgi:hypothetical protein